MLGWYDAIVTSVTEITAGRGATREGEAAFAALSERLESVIGARAATRCCERLPRTTR